MDLREVHTVGFNWQDVWYLKDVLIIRKQGNCALCWAMVCVDLVTLHLVIRYHFIEGIRSKDILASVQELLDMVIQKRDDINYVDDPETNPNCCYATTVLKGLTYIQEYGVTLEAHYPYEGKRNLHPEPPPRVPRIWIGDIMSLQYATPRAITAALKNGPVAGKILGYCSFRRHRGNGIYCAHVKNEAEKMEGPKYHTILVLGRGVETISDTVKRKFYYIKNSWGLRWGIGGYGRVLCKLVTLTWYPKHVTFEWC